MFVWICGISICGNVFLSDKEIQKLLHLLTGGRVCALHSVRGHSARRLVLGNLFEPLKLYDKASPLIVLLNFRFNAFYQAKQRTPYPWVCPSTLAPFLLLFINEVLSRSNVFLYAAKGNQWGPVREALTCHMPHGKVQGKDGTLRDLLQTFIQQLDLG